MIKKFFRFVLPSMLAFVFSSLYAIVDGFFVGRNVGDTGLAAINLAFPMTAFIQAVGTGIGMGGAIQIAVSRGKGDQEQERRLLGSTLSLLVLAGLAVMGVLVLGHRHLLMLLGARGEVLEAAVSYIRIIIGGTLFQLTATGLTPLLRNFDAALKAMLAMVGGFAINIALDAYFVAVLKWGMAGAAWATIIGQAVTVALALVFLRGKIRKLNSRCLRLSGAVTRQVVKIGLSPFGLTMCPNLVIVLMNKYAAEWGGDTAVAAYAVISYVICIVQLLLQGIGDGSQPLISFYLGMGQEKEGQKVRNLAYGFSFLVSVANLILLWVLRERIPAFFGASPQAGELAGTALPLFALGAVSLSFCRVTTSYFYSIKDNGKAYLLVYGEPVILFLLLFFGLPGMLGIWGVWLASPLAQIILLAAAVLLLFRKKPGAPEKKTEAELFT